MPSKRILIFAVILILLACSIAIIYYLAEANFYPTGVFWPGAITGFMGCLFIASLIATVFQIAAKNMLWKKRGIVFSILALSGLVTAILWFVKPGDSDVWWYGAIAGFFSCLLLVFLALVYFLISKLKSR